MANYKEANTDNWKGRASVKKDYWYQYVICCDAKSQNLALKKGDITLLGYACDEGVRRNQGRVGAAQGPEAIRSMMGSMSWHIEKSVYDCGDVVCTDRDMEAAQNELSTLVSDILKYGAIPIVIGGGHDIAYGHYMGIQQFINKRSAVEKIGILNFDAHFDLRTLEDKGTSGTPFYQIKQELIKQKKDLNYMCVGIQRAANSKELFARADSWNVQYLLKDQFTEDQMSNSKESIFQFINTVDHIYLTIDLDVFASPWAPGVSASSPVGISPDLFFKLLQPVLNSKKILSIDLAEMNPLYDIDNHTAKLAARIIEKISYGL